MSCEDMRIVIDSREQLPLKFRKDIETVTRKLDVGDYSIDGYENKIAIERKSPSDLFGSLGKGHQRFKREIQRAEDYDYFGILVEAPFKAIYNKEFVGSEYSKMKGDVIVQICYTLKFKYGVDIIFCNGRKEAKSLIRQLFKAWLKLRGK